MWHSVHSLQHTYVSSSYRSNRLGLSRWDPYDVRRGCCLELYYCNMVEWFWWDSSLISTTNWFPSMLWHCWFGNLTCKKRPRNDLLCIEWEVKPYTLTSIVACLTGTTWLWQTCRSAFSHQAVWKWLEVAVLWASLHQFRWNLVSLSVAAGDCFNCLTQSSLLTVVFIPKRKLRFSGHQIRRVIDWVRYFSPWARSAVIQKIQKIGTKVA